MNKKLRDGELNPGLPRDRRGYSPLYYHGLILIPTKILFSKKSEKFKKTIFVIKLL